MTYLGLNDNPKRGYILVITFVLFLLGATTGVDAHEFWIAPKMPNSEAGAPVRADVKVGQGFFGNAQVFLPSDIVTAGYFDKTAKHELKGTPGDQPVFNLASPQAGLTILFYEATPGNVEWDNADKFRKYLKIEGLDKTLSEHKKRGLPASGFNEDFLRHAKALVVRGAAQANDRALGLDYEIVLKTALGDLKPGATARFQVLWKSKPARTVAVNIFAKKGFEVEKRQLRTDEGGFASFLIAADTFYLLNAVHMVAVNKPEKTFWQSHWASLTFAVGLIKVQ